MTKDWKDLIKALFRKTPYKIMRASDANRFQAIEETLYALKQRGYAPKVVADGGANVGDFALLAEGIFGSETKIHMFEPQPACFPALQALTHRLGFVHHTVALSSIGGQQLNFSIDPSPDVVSTGAHVTDDTSSSISVQTATLDDVFGSWLTSDDRMLLKLDLQGWELEALKGSRSILSNVEVVLVEVSFFAQAYEPSIANLVQFLDASDFELYDIASLSARGRDNRPHQADFVFLKRTSTLAADKAWD